MRVVFKEANTNVLTTFKETWKPLPSDSRYEISDLGRVKNKKTNRILKGSTTPTGYKVLVLSYKNKKSKGVYIHREVMAAFAGECPVGLHVSHLNGNNADNRLSNLCYETPLENIRRKKEHGTQTSGENHGTAKLNSVQVSEIRNKRKKGFKLLELSKMYGVSFQHISRICNGENWAT